MSTNAKTLKELAAKLTLKSGGIHGLMRNLIVNGFFDTPKTTGEMITEIRQNVGKRLKPNVIQTYMKKFMENGIIYSFREGKNRGNFWVLANVDKARAKELVQKSHSINGDQVSSRKPVEALSLPAHPILQVTKTKILFLAANPKGMNPLALDKESRAIEEKIRASDHRDAFELLTKWAVRTDDLLQYLNQHRAHIIHFSGHGSANDGLFLGDSSDNPQPVNRATLKQLFSILKDNIRVVVLNACYSRSQAKAITEVIDCAIGMNKAIGDEAAIVFAAAFYQGLGFGRSVKDAFESGKIALRLKGIPEEKTPELIVRKGINPKDIFLVESPRPIHAQTH